MSGFINPHLGMRQPNNIIQDNQYHQPVMNPQMAMMQQRQMLINQMLQQNPNLQFQLQNMHPAMHQQFIDQQLSIYMQQYQQPMINPQMGMQPPPNYNQQTLQPDNRYGNPRITNNQPTYSDNSNRFQQPMSATPSSSTLQGEKEMEKFIPIHKVNFKIPSYKNEISTYIEAVKPSQIKKHEEVLIADHLYEGIVALIDAVNTKPNNKLINLKRVIVSSRFYMSTYTQEKFNDILASKDIRQVYKNMSSCVENISNIPDYLLISHLNDLLKECVNEYMRLKDVEVDIDTFTDDFNALNKMVESGALPNVNSYEFQSYLSNIVSTILEDNILVASSYEATEEVKNVVVTKDVWVCHVNKLSYELGLDTLTNKKYVVPVMNETTFITSLVEAICKLTQANSFVMVTTDRVTIQLDLLTNNEIIVNLL